jgi:hypothetical protein
VAKIRNISGDDRIAPSLGSRLVLAGGVVDIDPADVAAFTCQTTLWQPVDEEAQAAHDAASATPAEQAPSSEGEAA